MTVTLGGNNYEVSPSFMSLVRFRCERGGSFLSQSDDMTAQIQLLYTAIVDKKERPYFFEFEAICECDPMFVSEFMQFFHELFSKERPTADSAKESGKEFDELEILALCFSCGISAEVLECVNVFQLIALIARCCDLKNGTATQGELSSDERKQIYGITPEKEAEIAAFLQLTAQM